MTRRNARNATIVACGLLAAVITGGAMADTVDEQVYPDLARVDRGPLSEQERNDLTPEKLASWKQEDLDRLYARLTAGPIPDGFHQGTVIFAPGESLDAQVAFAKKMGIDIDTQRLKQFAEALWKGKVFYKQQGILRNRIAGEERFPAKVFCGQSLLDSRRESVVIDYAFTDTIQGYDAQSDWLAGREGVQVRDEIRMIRPGFYLGRAYMGKVFFLNFTLYKEDSAAGDEECWVGFARGGK